MNVMTHPRRIGTHGSYTVPSLPASLSPLSDWKAAEVSYVENSEGTVYLAVKDEKGVTLYPLAPMPAAMAA